MTHAAPTRPTPLPTTHPSTTPATTGPARQRPGTGSRSTTHRTATVALGAVLALGLSACGGDDPTGAPAPAPATTTGASPSATSGAGDATDHNAADVAFAQQMIVHHRGALTMAELAEDRADSPQVRALAERVTAAQGPEIETMSGWLESWGEEVPEGQSMPGSMAGHEMDGHEMDGHEMDGHEMDGHETGGHDMSGHGAPTDGATGGMEGMGGEEMPGMMSAQEMSDLEAASGTAFDRMWLTSMVAHHQGAVVMAMTEQAEGSDAEAVALAEVIESDQTAEITEMRRLADDL